MTIAGLHERLRTRVRALLDKVGEVLTVYERDQVVEFIEANESGVALETLIGYLVEGHHRVTRAAAEEAQRLAEEMGLGSTCAENLRKIQVGGNPK